MEFFSTRDHSRIVTASQAIAQGLSDEGGLFVPESFPQVDVEALCQLDYPELAAAVVSEYLTDYSKDFLAELLARLSGEPSAARPVIWPRWRAIPMPLSCGTARPAPSRIMPFS